MASYTPNLNLLMKDPVADGADTFNIETMLNQNFFTGAITVVHSPNLRQCHVRFVNQKQPIVRKIINQSRRLLARFSVGQIARIILNPFHETSFP